MEGRDELRHRRHRHALGDDRADAATDGKARDHQHPAGEIGRRLDQEVVRIAIPMPTMP